MSLFQLQLNDEAATQQLGAALGRSISQPEFAAAALYIALSGELGSGKTTLVRAILVALGHRGAVRSPTYTLVEPYPLAARTLYHLDLYRLGELEELEYLGTRELFEPSNITLIEWPERFHAGLPIPDLEINLCYQGLGRSAHIEARTAMGSRLAEELMDKR